LLRWRGWEVAAGIEDPGVGAAAVRGVNIVVCYGCVSPRQKSVRRRRFGEAAKRQVAGQQDRQEGVAVRPRRPRVLGMRAEQGRCRVKVVGAECGPQTVF